MQGFGHVLHQILMLGMMLWAFYALATDECKINAECGSDYFCSPDNTCERLPVEREEKLTVIQEERNALIIPSVLLGGFIIGYSIYVVRQKCKKHK